MHRMVLALCLFLLALACQTGLAAQDDLPERAIKVLTERCYRCHGGTATSAGLDVLNPQSLFGTRGNEQLSTQWVLPGKPDASMLWDAVSSEFMPLDDSPEAKAITPEERDLIRQWIDAGAKFPLVTSRTPLTVEMAFGAVKGFLDAKPFEDRKYFRFFSLTHLHNNPAVSDQELRFHRAALAKVLNSLIHHKRAFVNPEPIDASDEPGGPRGGTILALDIREMDWDRNNQWQFILDHYPYGVQYEFSENRQLRDAYNEVRQTLGTDQPFVRADWFVVYGAMHPLYTHLLDLPGSLHEIGQRLGVPFEENIEMGRVARSGFAKSGVSQQNRMIERHEGTNGYVWISYDFKPRRSRGDLARFPLGPAFESNPFNHVAFQHDGGELIFRLPNGMQGYMLALGDGKRLDEPAPTEIVFDSSGVTGSTAIVNGISCINCHARGMIAGFRDDVRESHAVGGDAQLMVEKTYVEQARMDTLIEADRQSYLTAETQVTGPWLVAEDIGEPVGKVAQRYFASIDVEAAARELDIVDGQTLRTLIGSNRELLSLGLGRFTQESPSTIQRVVWESVQGLSYWQEIVSHLQPGAMAIGPAALAPRPDK